MGQYWQPDESGAVDEIVAVIEEYDDRPNECTMFPADVSATERTSTWVTATEGSFVAVEDRR